MLELKLPIFMFIQGGNPVLVHARESCSEDSSTVQSGLHHLFTLPLRSAVHELPAGARPEIDTVTMSVSPFGVRRSSNPGVPVRNGCRTLDPDWGEGETGSVTAGFGRRRATVVTRRREVASG